MNKRTYKKVITREEIQAALLKFNEGGGVVRKQDDQKIAHTEQHLIRQTAFGKRIYVGSMYEQLIGSE